MQTEHKDTAAQDDTSDVAKAARRELDDAKARLSDAADRVRHEARHASSTISTLVLDELDRRAADMGTQIRSVAGRLRGETPDTGSEAASTMASHAADLIEDVSARLEGQSVRAMGERLSQFGRENPAVFVMGCLLTGAMAGRMIVASGTSHGAQSRSNQSHQSGGYTRASERSQSRGTQFAQGSSYGDDPIRSGDTAFGAASVKGTSSGPTPKTGAGVVGHGSSTTKDGSDAMRQSRAGSGKDD